MVPHGKMTCCWPPHTFMFDLDGSNLKRGEIALLISAVSFIATAAGFDVSLQSQGIHK
jgi:hypothetical protein